MVQYKIPQNVGIADKIVGPFSLKQLIIVGAGFGISYTIFALSSRVYELNILEYIIIALPTLIALAAALLKIYNVSFTKFILLTLEFAIKPKKRFWNHRAIAPVVDPNLNDQKPKPIEVEAQKKPKNINLRQLSATLDSGGMGTGLDVKHEDLDQVNDDDLITQAYFGHRRKEGPVHNMYWRTRDVQKKKLELLAKLPPVIPQVAQIPQVEAKSNIETSNSLPEPKEPVVKAEEIKASLETPQILTESVKKSEIVADDVKTEVSPTLNKVPDKQIIEETVKPEPPVNVDLKIEGNPVQEKKVTRPEIKNAAPNENKGNSDKKREGAPKPINPKSEIPQPKKEMVTDNRKTDPIANPIKSEEHNVLPHVQEPKKKRRNRNRKRRSNPEPVRKETQINTLEKSNPNKVVPKPINSKEATTSINDLQMGKEIEFNLD